MAYTPTNWKSGDVITSAKLNKLENGVATSGGGGVLVVTIDENTGALSKTWQEIHDADFAVVRMEDDASVYISPVIATGVFTNGYSVICWDTEGNIAYTTDSADGYPTPVET